MHRQLVIHNTNSCNILLQGFHWDSWRKPNKQYYRRMQTKSKEFQNIGFTGVWFPPPTESVSPQGYMPLDLYNLNSEYGTMDELKKCIETFHNDDMDIYGDVVINHRCAQYQNDKGIYNVFGGQLSWNSDAIISNDPNFQGTGNYSSGEIFYAAPNIDHSQSFVRNDLVEWMLWLKNDIGYDGFRFDFVRGFDSKYIEEYVTKVGMDMCIGEFWDGMRYDTNGVIEYHQDEHRQRIVDWIDNANQSCSAFDFTTKGVLQNALKKNEYWRLMDMNGKAPGVIGWWPEKAVTFIDNHDTGSTQRHWPFSDEYVLQGYAYILTHPGTPMVFIEHLENVHLKQKLIQLIQIRKDYCIKSNSKLHIIEATSDRYLAKIGENIILLIGNDDATDNLQYSKKLFNDRGVFIFSL